MYTPNHFEMREVPGRQWRWPKTPFGIPQFRKKHHFVPKTELAKKLLRRVLVRHVQFNGQLKILKFAQAKIGDDWVNTLTAEVIGSPEGFRGLLPSLNTFTQQYADR